MFFRFKMENQSNLVCEICIYEFNFDTRRPRVFGCGHTFCENCIGILIHDSNLCPKCKEPFNYASVESVPVNYVLISLLNESKERYSESFCSEHPFWPLTIVCFTCNLVLCEKCQLFHHSNCSCLPFPNALNEVKRRKQTSLKEWNECLANAEETTSDQLLSLFHEKQDIMRQIKSLKSLVKQLDRRVEEKKVLKTQLHNLKKELGKAKTKITSSVSVNDVIEIERSFGSALVKYADLVPLKRVIKVRKKIFLKVIHYTDTISLRILT